MWRLYRKLRASRLLDAAMKGLLLTLLFYIYRTGFGAESERSHPPEYRLDVIHYNDFHASFEEMTVETNVCRFNNASCLGGFPRLYYEVHTLLQEKPSALLLDAGDGFQGTYWYTLLKWNIIQVVMNLLPHDAHAIGNHDFDDGPEILAQYLKSLNAPVVAANIDTSDEPSLQNLYQPHIVVERNDRKIGIIGLITPDTKILSTTGNVIFTDPGEAMQREAQILSNQGVDIILVLSHCGFDVDKDLARDFGHNVDIIVGGHTHSLLTNTPPSPPASEPVAGPYPVLIPAGTDDKHQVLIVQASAFTKYVGNLTVYFDPNGDVISWEGEPILLDRTIPEDEKIKAKLAPFAKRVHDSENIRVGESLNDMLSDSCDSGECTLGDFLVDALDEYAKDKVKSQYDYVSLIQLNSIKHSIERGIITQGSVYELLPYYDRIESFELLGRYLLEALERSVQDATHLRPFRGPYVLQVSGIRLSFNLSEPEGTRVTSAQVIRSKEAGGSVPLESERYYQVTTPMFLGYGAGTNGYQMIKNNKKNVKILGRHLDVLESYIKNHSPLNISLDGRITINY